MAVASQIRVDLAPIGSHSRVWLPVEDRDDWFAEPVELKYVTAVTVRADCRELTRATVELLAIDGTLEPEVEQLVIRWVGGPRLWKLRRWWWQLRRGTLRVRR